jgi:uncharacterized NAD(P)/FAD-binding protein YdhS
VTAQAPADPVKTVAVVGGGLSGALFALKLIRARPDFRVTIIERGRRLGRGIAYGACAPGHLLNVPVSRMEVGLVPGFGEWLDADPEGREAMKPALVESGGDARAAFAPRSQFGRYLESRVTKATSDGPGPGLRWVRGEAVGVDTTRGVSVRLADGRRVNCDVLVLATGNLPPLAPGGPGGDLRDSRHFIADPWAIDAFDDVRPDDSILLLGTGLTTVDIALKLTANGHRGAMMALSRRGLVPTTHADGGVWPSFLDDVLPASPKVLMGLFRRQVALAEGRGVPWQRVFDAARPAIPAVWRSWNGQQRRQFLRHARPHWDVRRHRMAPRVADAFKALVQSGRLAIDAGRITGHAPWPKSSDGAGLTVTYRLRAARGDRRTFDAAWVVNCTGPRRDLAHCGIPLLAQLRDSGAATPDSLGLGLETEDCALIDRSGRPSDRLFALGPLTSPSWWEVVAVPEIALQVDRLVSRVARPHDPDPAARPLAAADFLDLGAGI